MKAITIGNNPTVEINDYSLTLDIIEDLYPLLYSATFKKKEILELSPFRKKEIVDIYTITQSMSDLKKSIESNERRITESKDNKYIERINDIIIQDQQSLRELNKQSEVLSSAYTISNLDKTLESEGVIDRALKTRDLEIELSGILFTIAKKIIKYKQPSIDVDLLLDKSNLTALMIPQLISNVVEEKENRWLENFTDLVLTVPAQ